MKEKKKYLLPINDNLADIWAHQEQCVKINRTCSFISLRLWFVWQIYQVTTWSTIVDCSFSYFINGPQGFQQRWEENSRIGMEASAESWREWWVDTISLRLPAQALDLVKPALLDALKCAAIKRAWEAQHQNEKPIPKLQSQAGCGSGYTLHLAMGIEHDHFLRIQVSSKLLYI